MKQLLKKFTPLIFIVLLSLIAFFSFYSINSFKNEYENLSKKVLFKDSFFKYKNILENQMFTDVHKNLKNQSDITLIDISSVRKKKKENSFEKEALLYFEKKNEVYSKIGNNEYKFAGVIKSETSCLNCHTNYKKEQIVGLLSISSSLKEHKFNLHKIEDKKFNFYFIFIILFLSIIFILFFFVKFYYNKKNKINDDNKTLLSKLTSKDQELKQSDEKFKKLITVDFLTGLPNKKYFFEMGNNSFHLSKRYKHDLSIIVLNIDSLEEIRNNYGKVIENKLTKHVVNIISLILRKSDIFAKIEEGFAIILNNTKEDGALTFIDKIKEKIAANIYNKNSIKITPSISLCLTQMKEEDSELDDLYQRAAKAIFDEKKDLQKQTLVY